MKWLAFFLLMGCAQVTSLNLKKHQFGILPTKIIWFQLAGFEEEQLAMFRFQQSGEQKSSFEESMCMGSAWSYNLYQIRNPAESSFLSQMTGKKNIKHSCEDATVRPIWSYITNNGYITGVYEAGANDQQSLTYFNQCGEPGAVFLSSLHLWLQKTPPKDAETFHHTETVTMKANQIFYDRSCNATNCGSSLQDNLKAIYREFQKGSQKNLFIIRDFSYLTALEKKDFVRAREILADMERAYQEALNLAKNSSDYLVLLTTGDSRFVDMPDQGRSWFEFEKNNKKLDVKRTKLTNLVLASGSRAENFCGMYDDSSVFERILSGPKQQGLELKIINPFK